MGAATEIIDRASERKLSLMDLVKGLALAGVVTGGSYGAGVVSNEQVTNKLNSIEIKLEKIDESQGEMRDRVTRLETRFEYSERERR